MLLEGSTHSCKLAPCDISTLVPPSTMIHNGPNTVSGKCCTTNCSDGDGAISGTAASAATFPYPTGRGTLIGDIRRGFCVGAYQAILNDIPTWTCACDGSNNPADWKGEHPVCLEDTGDVIASLRVDFSECFSLTYNETSVVRCSVGYTGVGDKNIP